MAEVNLRQDFDSLSIHCDKARLCDVLLRLIANGFRTGCGKWNKQEI